MRRDRSSGVTGTECEEYKKYKGRTGRSREKRGIGPAHALNPILTIFGMWGGPLDMFLKFEFRVGRSSNFGATGVKNRLFPILDTSLIQQLVATAQAVMKWCFTCCWKVTDYGLPSFVCGQDFQESEADQFKRKKALTFNRLHLIMHRTIADAR